MEVTLNHYLFLSFVLFTIGVTGVLLRRNIIIVFMSLELIFNAANISLVAFSYYLQSMTGRVFTVFTITIAAAEVAVGLAIMVAIYRLKSTTRIDDINEMSG